MAMKTTAPVLAATAGNRPAAAGAGPAGSAAGDAGALPPGPLRLREILVPIDFSDCSRQALRYALALARRFGASITLMYVIDFYLAGETEGRLDYAGLARDLRIRGSEQLIRLIHQDVGTDLLVDTLVRQGRPWKEITEAARERNTDLIILGTHGRADVARTVFGSTAERVVRHAPCPVLVVRGAGPDRDRSGADSAAAAQPPPKEWNAAIPVPRI